MAEHAPGDPLTSRFSSLEELVGETTRLVLAVGHDGSGIYVPHRKIVIAAFVVAFQRGFKEPGNGIFDVERNADSTLTPVYRSNSAIVKVQPEQVRYPWLKAGPAELPKHRMWHDAMESRIEERRKRNSVKH